jgi:hypothetical protein
LRKAGDNHQDVVERSPSRIPASASRTVPAHAEAIAVPWSRVEAIRVRAGNDWSPMT